MEQKKLKKKVILLVEGNKKYKINFIGFQVDKTTKK